MWNKIIFKREPQAYYIELETVNFILYLTCSKSETSPFEINAKDSEWTKMLSFAWRATTLSKIYK